MFVDYHVHTDFRDDFSYPMEQDATLSVKIWQHYRKLRNKIRTLDVGFEMPISSVFHFNRIIFFMDG